MPTVLNEYEGDDVSRSFNIAMEGGYLNRDYVKFYVRPTAALLDWVPLTNNEVTWTGAFSFTIESAIPAGSVLVVFRETPLTPLVDFQNTSRITERNLDIGITQPLHKVAELTDLVSRATTVASVALEDSADAVARATSSEQAALDAAAQAQEARDFAESANTKAAAAKEFSEAADSRAAAAATDAAAAVVASAAAVVTANEANTTAGTARVEATSAIATANQALSTAAATTSVANAAVGTANTAITTANAASTAASAAQVAASTAAADAADAALSAAAAVGVADAAALSAGAANATAIAAAGAAAAAVASADNANTTASAAASQAGAAVDTANTALSTANSASTAAGGAVTTANSATDTANTALTVANEAKDLVDEALSGTVVSFNGRAGAVTPEAGDYTKSMVGLGNVDNTADSDKPVSTAQQAALDSKADKVATVGDVSYVWQPAAARYEYLTDGVGNMRVLHRNTGVTTIFALSSVAVAVEGQGIIVQGSGGVDSVYVRPGTNVNCSGIGGGRDIIYLPSAWADYTKTILNTSTMAFHRPGTPEYVVVPRGSNALRDLLVFTDGAVENYPASLALVADIGVALSTITTYDPLTTTPDEPPAGVPLVRGIAPADKLLCDGRAVSRSLYPALFARIGVLAQVPCTITIANPAVVSGSYLEFTTGVRIRFSTTGALPTGLLPDVDYYVTAISSGTQCTLSATPGGAAIKTSGSQSGVHTATTSSYGLGDGTTTFNLPTLDDAGFGIRPFIRF